MSRADLLATSEPLRRHLALQLARITESAAVAAGRFMGRGDRDGADGAAVAAMRAALATVDMAGVVVIGEGEKDQAPMLYIGEEVGNGRGPAVDVAVDPIDGTRLLARGLPNAITAVALAARGAMHCPREFYYMEKIAVGAEARGHIDLDASVGDNLNAIAAAKGCPTRDLTVVMLDRDRHQVLQEQVRRTGARIKLIHDGDIAGGILAGLADSPVDVLMGAGGTPEAVLTAAALRCLGGEIVCRVWPRDDADRRRLEQLGHNPRQVFTTTDLVGGDDVFFAATGVTDGDLMRGVRYGSRGARTWSLVLDLRDRSVVLLETQALEENDQSTTVG